MYLNSIQYFLINPSKRDIVMNKIFKVVWNRTIGSFVVTSELAKGHVKSSSEGSEGDVRTSWEGRLKELVPGFGIKLNDNPQLAEEIISHNAKVLGIHHQ